MLLWMDSFSGYGLAAEAALLDGSYAEVANGFELVADPDGVSAGQVLYMDSPSDGVIRKVLPNGPVSTLFLGSRVYLAALPTNDARRPWPFLIRNASNQSIGYIAISTTGAIQFYFYQDGGSGWNPTLVATSSPVITTGSWWHLECEFNLNPLNFVCRVEGEVVLETSAFVAHSDITTISQYCFFRGINAGSGANLYVKDHYCCDDSGTELNTLLGSVRVGNITTDADDDLDWTLTGGSTGYTLLDNKPATLVDYAIASDAVIPLSSIFGLENLASGIDVIKAVMTKVKGAKADGGEGNMRVDFTVDGTYTQGDDRSLGVGFGHRHDIFTSAGYTPAAMDNSKIKITRTA